ncbi:uncharacterized protein PHALS_14607 [Plasmopara halstedii]|uniref:RxLR-like protein n=1 Tax=Plasmopara halstedii TaxID=4781 RepID=A0A0P1AM31_PLAHL|nr:uncharacterized protein PHALS_14607 [Plasmopara halstedii]CEG42254.1 hypothetical protein PHALS_14607 [Plasmopara halstedii]|eukprot:XP_024578623.1 hypothetical protein PHALS_14607 [Plasmopara halstedii]
MAEKRYLSIRLRILLLSSIAFLACPGPYITAAIHGVVALNDQPNESTLTSPSANDSEERVLGKVDEKMASQNLPRDSQGQKSGRHLSIIVSSKYIRHL